MASVWPVRGLTLRHFLLLSAVVHGCFLLVHFSQPQPQRALGTQLEVILVNAQSATAPEQARLLAQVALEGGGPDDSGRATTLPSQAEDEVAQRELLAASERLAELEALQSRLAGVRPAQQSPQADATAGRDPVNQRELEIKRLQAQVADNIRSYNERPRKHFFSPTTSPYEFALYEEAWRTRVEMVGNSNYPEELKGKIYGRLQLTAYIRADGSLEDVEVDRSSGSAVLDRAAVRLLRMSAPFSPFPASMRSKADVLAITRTWVFSRDRVTTEF